MDRCHCEERSDEAISHFSRRGRLLRSLRSLAMTSDNFFFNRTPVYWIVASTATSSVPGAGSGMTSPATAWPSTVRETELPFPLRLTDIR